MVFKPQMIAAGTTEVAEYSLYHPAKFRWLTITNGAISLDSADPVSLGLFYDAPDVGTEDFAFAMLDWLRDQSDSGEIIDGRYVDIPTTVLDGVGVFSFQTQQPLMVPTGLEFDHDFRTSDIFEVRGLDRLVEDYVNSLDGSFRCSIQRIDGKRKTVRLTRSLRKVG